MDNVVHNAPLWSVTIWDKNFSGVDKTWQPKTIKYKYLLSDELDRLNTGGDVRLLYTGKEIGFTSEELAGDALCDGEIVSIPWGGTPSVKYYKGKFVTGDNRIATSSKPDELLNKYIYYYLKGHLRELASFYRGAGLKHPSMKDVLKMNISYPSIPEQLEIIAQFEALEKVFDLRQQELQLLDDLIKAQFVEMFGEPVSNPKGWGVLPWERVFDTRTGKLDSNASVEGGEYPFFTCAKEWLWIDKYAYDCEALLLAGNNAAGVYDVKHYKGKFNAYQRTYILHLKDKDWSYPLFKYQLEDRLQYLQSQSKGTNTRYLTMGILNSLDFIVPPKAMQDAFALFVAQVDKSKSAVQKALDEAQLLFDSLMQQYFG